MARRAKVKVAVPEEGFTLVGASLGAGAVSGAAVGAVAGPPGAILGGVLGAGVGLLAGAVLDVAEHQAARHDRDLDDAIGVTRGGLGARGVRATRSLASQSIIDEERGSSSAAALLRAEHARLEVIYDRLLEAYRLGDWNDVRAEWETFERSLRAHMDLEEARVFPSFMEVDSEVASELLAQHVALRERLDVLGVNVELHALTHIDANELVELLRAHRAREERLLYPWIDATFTAPVVRDPTT